MKVMKTNTNTYFLKKNAPSSPQSPKLQKGKKWMAKKKSHYSIKTNDPYIDVKLIFSIRIRMRL